MSSSVCRYYRRGSCQYGHRCRKSHDLRFTRPDSQNLIQAESSDDDDDDDTRSAVAVRRETTSRPTPRSQILPNSANKSSETNETASQDKWSLKNNTREMREGTPDNVLLETVKKINEAENLVTSLRQQLRVKNDDERSSRMKHQIKQCLKSYLQCNLCNEIFIKPTVLNCSHTFCHECIESWTQTLNQCPTCQDYVQNKSYCLTLDTYLDKISVFLPDEIKTKREAIKVEHNNNRVEDNYRNQDAEFHSSFGDWDQTIHQSGNYLHRYYNPF